MEHKIFFMPEGPSILHLSNQLKPFIGKTVESAGGYGPMPTDWINGQRLIGIRTWGKHLLLIFPKGTVRIHLMLFGSVLINQRKKVNRSFFVEFADGTEINGYVVKAQKIEGELNKVYDWRNDILSDRFDTSYVKELLKKHKDEQVDDVLMNQEVFAGVGNKIRNDALYLAGIHPESVVGKIPAKSIAKLIAEVRKYAHLFYDELEKTGKHSTYFVYKKEFADDGSEVTMRVLPKSKRKIYFSGHKQRLFN